MTISRRSFVKGGIASSALVVIKSGCGNDVSPAPIVDATINDDPTSARYGQIEVVTPMYPDLTPTGGAVTLRLAALSPGTRPFIVPPKGVLLVHRGPLNGDTAEYIATNSQCPHQGCPLGYSAKDQLIECPCHGSRFFSYDSATNKAQCTGAVEHRPAASNLTTYTVDIVGDSVYVDLNTAAICDLAAFPPVVSGTITIPIADYPALSAVGGSLIGKPVGLSDTLIVAHVTDSGDAQFVTVSDICTHQGCAVALDEANTRFACPCHGSEFAFSGSVIQGPAPTALKSYTTTFDGANVVISTS
jgi:cytochrome b6-f complex iron-sulfur subunit